MANETKHKVVIRFVAAFMKDGANDDRHFFCTYDEMMRILKIIADDFPPFPIRISIYKPSNPNCYATCEDLAQLNTIIAQENYIISLFSKVNAILYPSETRCYDRE